MEGMALSEGHVGLKGQRPVRVSCRSPTWVGHVVPAGVGLVRTWSLEWIRYYVDHPGSVYVLHVRLSQRGGGARFGGGVSHTKVR